jgi:hypothetical protein
LWWRIKILGANNSRAYQVSGPPRIYLPDTGWEMSFAPKALGGIM